MSHSITLDPRSKIFWTPTSKSKTNPRPPSLPHTLRSQIYLGCPWHRPNDFECASPERRSCRRYTALAARRYGRKGPAGALCGIRRFGFGPWRLHPDDGRGRNGCYCLRPAFLTISGTMQKRSPLRFSHATRKAAQT